MKFNLAISVGVVALVGLLGVTIAEMQTTEAQPDEAQATDGPAVAQPVQDVQPEQAEAPAADPGVAAESQTLPPPSIAPPAPTFRQGRDPAAIRGRGLFIRPDGTTVGRVVGYVDRNTLLLVPLPNAVLTFLQDRKIVAQATTDENGRFSVQGLTPWSVCSVILSSSDWIGAVSAVIRPLDDANDRNQAAGENVGVNTDALNEIRLASMIRADDNAGEGEESLDLQIQPMPREDFAAGLQAGLFGSDVGGLPPAPMYPGGGLGAAGGGGGGGAGGGGLGAGLMGAGVAAGMGAAIGASQSADDLASPFEP